MPTNDQGVLSSTYGLPPGALGGGGIEGVGTALQGAGAWLQSANNPGGAAAMLSGVNEQQQNKLRQLLALKPEWTQVGTGIFGPRYGWVSPLAAMRAQATGGAPQGGQAAPGGSTASAQPTDVDDTAPMEAAFTKYQNGQASGQDVLNAAPPMVAEYAKSLISGQADPRFLGARASALRMAAIPLAHIMDPTFTEQDIDARQKLASSKGSTGPTTFGGQINSANTVMGHMMVMSNALDQLKALGVTGGSSIKNFLTQGIKDNITLNPGVQAALSAYDKGLQGVAGEMTKITRGSNGSLQEVQDWKSGMQPYSAEPKLRAGLATMIDMMHSRLSANTDQWNNAFHTKLDERHFMSPTAQAAEDHILGADQYGPAGTGGSQQAPQAAAPAASSGEVRYFNGKAYTRGPNGEAVPVQ